MKSKKGQLQMLTQLAVGIATLAIVLVVAFLVMAEGKSQSADISGEPCNSSHGDQACNSTKTLQNAVDTIPGWVPLIIVAAIGGAILGIVALYRRN